MANLSELNSTLYRNDIAFLENLSNVLPKHCLALRSIVASKSAILTSFATNTTVVNKSLKKCPRCCLPYDEGPPIYSIKPELRKFAKYVLTKATYGKQRKLTQYQARYLKKLGPAARLHSNYLVRKCRFCLKENIEHLPSKPQKEKLVKTKKRKKPKKDKFSGLNPDAVLEAQHITIDDWSDVEIIDDNPTPTKKIKTDDEIKVELNKMTTPQNSNKSEKNSAKKQKKKKITIEQKDISVKPVTTSTPKFQNKKKNKKAQKQNKNKMEQLLSGNMPKSSNKLSNFLSSIK